MSRRWLIHPHDPQRISQLERAAGVSPVVAQLLICRGIDDAATAREFLEAKLTLLRDPNELPGVGAAVERIHWAIDQGEKIVVYGDYDADGVTGTSILLRCLKLLKANVTYHTPNRLEEGYGLNGDALGRLNRDGAKLIISVDCGIASVNAAKTAKELGLSLIVTDHHQFADELPPADAIVHPRLPGSSYPFAGLCGAGVALKLAWALCQRAENAQKVSPPMRAYLLSAVALATIGTIADVVPLLDENRVLVRHGLALLAEYPLPGLPALMKAAKLNGKKTLTAEDVAFSIAPRINAAGRLGQAELAVELLTTESRERAGDLANYLNELNSQRTSLERSIYRAANKQAKEDFNPTEDPALVLAGRGWHAGVIGIVAARLADKYHRPVVIISQDKIGAKPATGSCRTAGGIDLHAGLAACDDHLVGHGGHSAAAGLTVEDRQIDAFRDAFCEYVAAETSIDERIAEVRIDAEAPLSQLTLQTVQQIETLAPFGQANPRPVLCCNNVQLCEPPRKMGAGERHLALKVSQGESALRAVAFGRGDWADELAGVQTPLEIAYRPVINEFRGRRTVELHLVDWRQT